MAFLSTLLSGDENSERESNPILYPAFTYLPGSEFLANLTPLNKQPFKVKSGLKSGEHVSNSWTIKKLIIFWGVKVALFLNRFL